jgi:plasmid stability protein
MMLSRDIMDARTPPVTSSLLIPNVDPALRARLKERAKRNRRSMSEEAREMLRGALAQDQDKDAGKPETLYQIANRIFGEDGGFDLDIPPRSEDIERPPPDFSGPCRPKPAAG